MPTDLCPCIAGTEHLLYLFYQLAVSQSEVHPSWCTTVHSGGMIQTFSSNVKCFLSTQLWLTNTYLKKKELLAQHSQKLFNLLIANLSLRIMQNAPKVSVRKQFKRYFYLFGFQKKLKINTQRNWWHKKTSVC